MKILPIKSEYITINSDLIKSFLTALNLKKIRLEEKDIVAISSKVVSVTEGRVVEIKKEADFTNFVKKEADLVLCQEEFALTYTKGILIPNSGIDRSNIKFGQAVLYPENPQKSADNLREKLKKHFKITNLGIIIVDSHCVPLRRGVSGLALAFSGFEGVEDWRGKKDLCGNILKVTQRNLADSLASAALVVMGETKEQTPFALIRSAPVKFTSRKIHSEKELSFPPSECLFKVLYPKKLLEK